MLPVVAGTIHGMITDRDICLAASKKETQVSRTKVSEVMSGEVYNCAPSDEARDPLKVMRKNEVQRLPVVNSAGVLKGILSLSDILIHAHKAKGKKGRKLSYKAVARTMEVICAARENYRDCSIKAQQERQAFLPMRTRVFERKVGA